MIGLLALHTTELQENVPVIEVMSFFMTCYVWQGKSLLVLQFIALSFH